MLGSQCRVAGGLPRVLGSDLPALAGGQDTKCTSRGISIFIYV